jgi:hypothetical protein
MSDPRTLAVRAERLRPDERQERERFNGYGVMGLPFASGHILGLRRFPASSIGPGYTSIWHRNPAGDWTFYANVEPLQSCNRFFGSAVMEFRPATIAIDWTGPSSFAVRIAGELEWSLTLQATPVTRLMNALGSVIPEALWQSERVLSVMGALASLLLGAGKLRLAGWAPNGQRFIANPRLIWTIPESRAVLKGEDFGPPGPVSPQAWLGDFAIPNRGLLAFGNAAFEPFDAARHLAAATSG